MDIIDDAVYKLIHGAPGGAPELSRQLYSQYGYKVAPGTLMNKANPDQDHQLTVREGLLIQRLQNALLLLNAEAHTLNCSVIPLGDFANTSDTEFLNTYTTLHARLGDMATVINDAFSDGRITRDEVRQVRSTIMSTIRAMLELESRFKSLCDERLDGDLAYA